MKIAKLHALCLCCSIIAVGALSARLFADCQSKTGTCGSACTKQTDNGTDYCDWVQNNTWMACVGGGCSETYDNGNKMYACSEYIKLLPAGQSCNGDNCSNGTFVIGSGDLIPNQCTNYGSGK